MSIGRVYICGAGPGDPKLMTVRAMELLKSCDVVLYDRLVGQEIIDQIPKSAEKVYVGRAVGDPTTHQKRTNELMVKYARKNKSVLRLKGATRSSLAGAQRRQNTCWSAKSRLR